MPSPPHAPPPPQQRSVRTTLRRTGRWAITLTTISMFAAWILLPRAPQTFHQCLGFYFYTVPGEFRLGYYYQPVSGPFRTFNSDPGFGIHPIFSLTADSTSLDNWEAQMWAWSLLPALLCLTLCAWRPRWFIRRIPAPIRWGAAILTAALALLALAGPFAGLDLNFGLTTVTLRDRWLEITRHITTSSVPVGLTHVWGSERWFCISRFIIISQAGGYLRLASGTTWPFFAMLTLTSALWLIDRRAHQLRTRHRLGMCPKCNYDRAGFDPTSPCPECGYSVTPR